MSSDNSPVLTYEEAAEYLNTSMSSLRRTIKDGYLKPADLPYGRPRIRRADLDALMDENTPHDLEKD